jgi:NitT/TauT family transport system ATP-binding protein/nitrate/nitrite transport system substrate-binding protein
VRHLDPISDTLEKTELKLGYIPLSDCAPLIIAQELGFFERMGLSVELKQQMAWSTLRDRVLAGDLDGAQMLAPLLVATNFKFAHPAYRIVTGLTLSRNGNAITVSKSLIDSLESIQGRAMQLPLSAANLVPLMEKSERPLVFASVHPFSNHELLLRHWLRGLPERLREKWRIVVVPPARMVDAMSEGQIDGFCVGGPWNAAAVRMNLGVTVATSLDLLPDHIEKVFAVTSEWQERNPKTHLAVLRALLGALAWLDSIPNRLEAARMLWDKHYIDAPLDVIAPSLINSCLTRAGDSPRSVPGYHRFSGLDCNVPSVADANMIGNLLHKHGLLSAAPSIESLQQSFLEPVYREALR